MCLDGGMNVDQQDHDQLARCQLRIENWSRRNVLYSFVPRLSNYFKRQKLCGGLGTRLGTSFSTYGKVGIRIKHIHFLKHYIIEYGSTLYVGMAQKKNGGPIKCVQNLMFRTLLWM